MIVKPNDQNCFDLLLTLTTQTSHHDPATGDGSNTLTFNRQTQMVERDVAAYSLAQERVTAFCQANPIPADLLPIFEQATFQEFTASALIKFLLDMYNSPDGTGVFSGMDRYEKLESRVRSAATRSFSLRGFWARLCRDLRLPIHSGGNDTALIAFYSLPVGLQQDVLALMVREYRSVVTLARAWHTIGKTTDDFYASAIGSETQSLVVASFDAANIGSAAHNIVPLEVPVVSANSLRHQVIREPAWFHLVKALELSSVLPGIEALFVNGGNIRQGAKSPSNSADLARIIRGTYPPLDLLGGCCDSFDLGEGRLSVAGWIVCRENANALTGTEAEYLPLANVSVFDILDDVTHTRQATEAGLGQMIWNFETLATGLNIIVRLSLHPFTSSLSRSALFAAIEQFRQYPTIAGQAARGFGWCEANWLDDGGHDAAEYEAYLVENREALIAGIESGKLGTAAQVFK